MDLKTLIDEAFNRFNAAITMWNFLGTVILGLLAFTASARQTLGSVTLRALLSIGFTFYATVNFTILYRIEAQRRVFESAAVALLPGTNISGLGDVLHAPAPWQITAIHLTANCALLAAIWIIPELAKRETKAR